MAHETSCLPDAAWQPDCLRHPNGDDPTSEARDLGNLVRDSDRQQFILRATRFFNDNMESLSRDDYCSIYEQCFKFSICSFFTLYDRSKLESISERR